MLSHVDKCFLIPKMTVPSSQCGFASDLSNKWFAAILKEIIKSFLHLAWLGREDDPPNKDRFPLYKQS